MNTTGHGGFLLAVCGGLGEVFLLSMAKCLPSGNADLPLHVSTKQTSPRLHMTIPHHKPRSLQHWCLVLKQPLAKQQPNEDDTWNPHKDARGSPGEKGKTQQNSQALSQRQKIACCLHLGTFSMSRLNSVLRREGNPASCF